MKNLSLYIDIVFCVVVLPVMAMIFPIERWIHNFQWYVLTVGIWLYVIYFINRLATVPLLFHEGKQRLAGILIIAITLVITYFLSKVYLYSPRPNTFDVGFTRILPAVQPYQQFVWSLFMIVEAFSFAVGLLTQTNLQRMRRRAVEAERDKAEIELYKAQIKPHFMFNTLNSLYGLFLTHNEKALASLEKFISMMRYMYTSSGCDLVSLENEVDYIRQYVGLQSLRLNDMTSVSLDIDITKKSMQVPPMLLVTFVENCFKHGVSPVEHSNIEISLVEKDGKLSFTTANRIFPVKRIGEHMGIKNCRKRLDLLFPDRHTIEISDDGIYFYVKLCIDLNI